MNSPERKYSIKMQHSLKIILRKLFPSINQNQNSVQSRSIQKKQLLVDVSELVQRDAKTGIQRVVRSTLKELLLFPPDGYTVEPVYATKKSSYHYARRFTAKFLSKKKINSNDSVVETRQGDVFLALDFQADIIIAQKEFLVRFRKRGGTLYFVIYDLLPITLPDYFHSGMSATHKLWLETITGVGDGALCISRSVADEFKEWIQNYSQNLCKPFNIGWFHLGADISSSLPTSRLPKRYNKLFQKQSKIPNILMVGTIEPRKGHAQALAAFELLWQQGIDIALVIVGKTGWDVKIITTQLCRHKELNKRLFWFDNVSDGALLKLYKAATGVLMASSGEGFGLPLIEAAQHNCPILARDLPVFFEVAGNHASYFSGFTPEELADAIKQWNNALIDRTAPETKDIEWLTWKESTGQLLALLSNPDHPNWAHYINPSTSFTLPDVTGN